MTAVEDSATGVGPEPTTGDPADTRDRARTRRGGILRILRYVAIAIWAAVIVYRTVTDGFAFNRELLLLYICTGLLAASIGQGKRMLYVIRDWLPFALVLVAYDLSRGAATLIGRPTLWHWQVDVDRWLFFGTVPTVWLQEHLKLPHPPWWEVVISTVYMSFFILPYVVAGVLWLRDREEWKKFVRLFVGLSFAALAIYALVPAAPPWAAARCTPSDVEGGPSGPRCMFRSARGVADGGLLGPMQSSQDGANDWIERIVTRGWGKLNLHSATALIDQGQASVNLVAAIPSLHAGLTAGVAAFLWYRVNRKWRPLLVAYPLIMAFTLVYTAEHYVVDILLGWALAATVIFVFNRFHAFRRGRSGEVDLAQRLGDGPHGAGAGLESADAAGAQVQRGAAVGELDRT
ncbi:phosphatase PAP2 family protein [Mycolicibacterium smegmatis]|uniref:Phosphoesterase, PA-phosphatase related protein n=2 Tax=Mycolicibacterium smegmatis (strain ATCC 700084 / mc(2)155) TaxID=246196 RepID=I7FG18_MYCS2|nr:phosphatase PAP2 family protein [Mycolicibacterium smegmatis]ABK76165.1 PAP2 superfamily protein [Mycolicibacterium smegmatis MC2 155]AFP37818.1 Phosphoesterase, PA-phosphatase related protein [Mycolicibacterium smegmatis MC2 155]AIU06623.1 phosphoesterase [Mycolicibacterium smegmatis MC2 155]AIU13248.1 phosphoesterase [Mycolicibacterium smegmatis]AIU19872.1 phosphoesterase [Mycolicibacterium smegmatis]